MYLRMPVISVIIPVYNSEKYLHQCVDSILAQTFTEFELLLIDDGSDDSSGKICDDYSIKDPRVRVFHKKNGGVSSARNLGIDNAQGKWITFVDSDDWVNHSFLESISSSTDDLIISAYISHWQDKQICRNVEECQSIGIKEIGCDIFTQTCFSVPWGKGFKTSIIKTNQILFDVCMNSHEDTLFMYKYLSHIASLSFTSTGIYYYRIHENGLSSKLLDFSEIEYGIKKFTYVMPILCEKCGIKSIGPLLHMKSTYLSMINLGESYEKIYHIVRQISTTSLFSSLFIDKEHVNKGRRRKLIDMLFKFKQYHIIAIIAKYTRKLY